MELSVGLGVLAVLGCAGTVWFGRCYLRAQRALDQASAQLQSASRDEERMRLMKAEFEVLSQTLLEARATQLKTQQQESLETLLSPLKTELAQFKARVNEVYERETRDRMSLHQEILSLKALNQQMSAEANNLTRALKGENKTAGNWGELVLDRVLSASGLREGHEYLRQPSLQGDQGRLQPDVIVNLPDQKCLIVDAKLSLKDYERASSAVDEATRVEALKAHTQSMRTHVRGLSGKQYSGLSELTTVDFVIMFVPVEPAFSAAFDVAPTLFTDALSQGVVIASPTTLLALLRTVEHVWRVEHQNRNTREIADLGGKLFDQFVLFAESFEEIGDRLQRSQDAYEKARGRLSTGRGNLVRRAEQLRALGANAARALPETLKQDGSDD
ncbi:MAG: DNA recombination protein RmuC [Gammaproteobacteria bacterium]|nr:DNA recombination protein RmuC [Gammaproteobacteria bacterium]